MTRRLFRRVDECNYQLILFIIALGILLLRSRIKSFVKRILRATYYPVWRIRRRLRRRSYLAVSLGDFIAEGGAAKAVFSYLPEEIVDIPGPTFVGEYSYPLDTPMHVSLRSPPVRIVEFADAVAVGGTDLVFSGAHAVHADVVRPERDMFHAEVVADAVADFNPGNGVIHFSTVGRTVEVESAVSLLGECTGNYAHWLCETLPKVLALNEYTPCRDLPLLVDGWIHPVFFQTLSLLDDYVRPVRRVNRWQMVRTKRLIYVTPPSYTPPENRAFFRDDRRPEPSPDHYQFSPRALSMLRVKAVASAKRIVASSPRRAHLPNIFRVDFVDHARASIHCPEYVPEPDTAETLAKRVYLRRNAVTSGNPRQLQGQDRIESILAEYGFVAVDTAALSFAEQVMLLQGVECVVGPIGAAFANLIFAPPGRKVIALAPYYCGADYFYFSNLMGALSHELCYVLGPQRDQPDVHLRQRDYDGNLIALRQALEMWCIT